MRNFHKILSQATGISVITRLAVLIPTIGFSATVFAADYVFKNGSVYTVDQAKPWANAVAVEGNEIVYVGNNAGVEQHITENTQVIDLEGKMLLPGFIDTHMHPGVGALMFNIGVHLIHKFTPEEYLDAVREYAAANPEIEVIGGFGFRDEVFEDGGPTKELLDQAVSDRPVFIVSGGGHSAWANTKAMEVLGIDKDTPDPQEGVHFYKRDADGNPTGYLLEGAAFWSHLETLGLGTKQHFLDGYPSMLGEFPTAGITALFDAGTPGVQEYALQALVEMDQAGILPVRYNASNYIITREHAQRAVPELERLKRLYTSEMVRPVAIKISNDGAAPDGGSHIQFEEEELTGILTDIAEAGADVMIHVTGPETIAQGINAMERARAAVGNHDSRFVLTHINTVEDKDFARLRDVQIIPSVQPAMLGMVEQWQYWMFMASSWFEMHNRVGMHNSMINAGAMVTISSDYPACPGTIRECSPLVSIAAAHNRQKFGEEDAWIIPAETERTTLADMIRATTINAAYQVRMEDEIGSIETGKLADMIVLEKNLFEIGRHEIHDTKVLMTMVNGRIVFDEM